MKIDYELIKLHHRVDGIYSDTDTHKRLNEIRNYRYPNSPQVKHLVKAASAKRESPTQTELEVYRSFPDHGLMLSAQRNKPGTCSNALMFAASLPYSQKRQHAAIIQLVRLKYLGIVRGCVETEDGKKTVEILTKLNG